MRVKVRPPEGLLNPEVLQLAEQLHRVVGKPFTPLSHWTPAQMDGPWNGEWKVAPIPEELQQRRVELVVSANDTQGIAEGLRSGSEAMVLDFDDTFSPTWANVLQANKNLEQLTTNHILLLRPRPLYLLESNVQIHGQEAIAGLLDLSAYLANRRNSHRLYIYIPKLETLTEAEQWDAVLTEAERALSLPENTIRVGIQIETLPAAFQAEALLYVFRERAFGLNAGRWDYVFSLTKHLGRDRNCVLPERDHLGMEQPFLQAYEQVMVQVSHKHGAQAIGGSAALVPDAANPEPVLKRVAADKAREASLGFDAAWAGHPALVEVVRSAFVAKSKIMPIANPRENLLNIEPATTLQPPLVRDTLNLALNYLAVWLQGQGVLVRGGRTEDIATVELARTQLWQWVHHRMPLVSGVIFDAETYQTWRAEEVAALGTGSARLAGELLDQLVLARQCPDYFTRMAYPYLRRFQENACPMNLEQLNQLSQTEFVQALGAIFEHSPWVAEQAWQQRPFASVEALHTAMVQRVQEASREAQLDLICAHPDLGARAKMADASIKEQAGAGLNQLTADEFAQITRLNREYTGRFGFPFIFAVKGRSKLDVFASMQARLSNDAETEFVTALEQIYKIARFRLEDAIKE